MSDTTAAAPVVETTVTEGAQPASEEANTTPAETTTAPKKWKLPVNGGEKEFDEKEILDRAARWDGSQGKLDRLAKLERQQAELEGLKNSNPREYLKRMGIDRNAAEQWLYDEFIKYEQMEPQERERAEFQREKAQWEAKQTELQRQHEAQQYQESIAREEQSTGHEIIQALEQYNLPRDNETVATMALYMEAMATKLDPNDPDQSIDMAKVAELTRARMDRMGQGSYAGLKGDALLSKLGDEMVREVVSAHLAKVKAQQRQPEQTEARMPRPNPKPQATQGRKSWERMWQDALGK